MSYGIKEDQNIPRKKHTPEEIVAKLRQVDVHVSQGSPVADAVRQIGVTEGALLPLAPGKRWTESGSG
jgi:hypothetical protein